MKTRTAQVLIDHLRRDGGTQIRAALDESTVADYADAMKAGEKLPAAIAYFDGKEHWLSDGFHRVEAELRCGHKRMAVEIREGSRADAILEACAANSKHGLRRSNADKRRAVETALLHPVASKWSGRQIAKHCGVDHATVEKARAGLCDVPSEQSSLVTLSEVVKSPPIKGSKSGQPTAVHTPAANPTEEGDEEVGEKERPERLAAPASSIDLLGIDDIDPAWLRLAEEVVTVLDAFDGYQRQAQASVCDLLGRQVLGAQLQALRKDAHDLAARARKSVRPKSVCLYCKDPDGTAGRREQCNGCRGLGWLTEEQLGAVPRELEKRGEEAQVIETKRGGYVPRPRALKVELVDEAGVATPFEGDETEGGW